MIKVVMDSGCKIHLVLCVGKLANKSHTANKKSAIFTDSTLLLFL